VICCLCNRMTLQTANTNSVSSEFDETHSLLLILKFFQDSDVICCKESKSDSSKRCQHEVQSWSLYCEDIFRQSEEEDDWQRRLEGNQERFLNAAERASGDVESYLDQKFKDCRQHLRFQRLNLKTTLEPTKNNVSSLKFKEMSSMELLGGSKWSWVESLESEVLSCSLWNFWSKYESTSPEALSAAFKNLSWFPSNLLLPIISSQIVERCPHNRDSMIELHVGNV